jgi:hypothetical protein
MSRLPNFLSELFRRKVVRVLCGYVAVFWLLAQGFASLFPVLGVPDWWLRVFIIAGLSAVPVLALLTWKYDLVLPQLVRDPKDVDAVHPTILWAARRHDSANAGHLVLNWRAPDQSCKQQRFFEPVSIGREPTNSVELEDKYVSRFHAVLWAEGGAWHVRDLDSTNGTFLDSSRVSGNQVLPEWCELHFHMDGPTVRIRVDKPTETVVPPDD